MVPPVLPVRILRAIFSVPSVRASALIGILILPVLLLIVKLPELAAMVKSELPAVPELVQYRTVLLGTLVVVTVNNTLCPSSRTV